MQPYLGLRGNYLTATVSACTSVGFLLVGYDNGVMGGIIDDPPFQTSFPATVTNAGLLGTIVAIYTVGCFLGSLVMTVVAEPLGRRRSLLIGGGIMLIGCLLQASSFTVAQLIVGRIVSGCGMGFVNSTIPIFMSEIASPFSRGRLLCVQICLLNLGVAITYWFDYGLSFVSGSKAWRIPVAFQSFFIILMILFVSIAPETPRWLIAHDKDDVALDVIARLKRCSIDDVQCRELYSAIRENYMLEKQVIRDVPWKQMLWKDALQSSKRVILCCIIQICQQLGGNNAVLNYETTIFNDAVGLSLELSNLMSGFLSSWLFIAAFIPVIIIDLVGRRKLMLYCLAFESLVLASLAACVSLVEAHNSRAAGIGAAVMLFLYVTFFTVGFQAVPWIIVAEIIPLRMRGRGSAMATASNWIFNFVVVEFTPPALANIGYQTYIIFSIFNAAWIPVVYFFYPETAGKSLEQIDMIFAEHKIFRKMDARFGGKVPEEFVEKIAHEFIEHTGQDVAVNNQIKESA